MSYMFSRPVRPLAFLGSFVALAAMIIASSSTVFAADPSPTETLSPGNMGATATFTAGNNTLTLDGSDHTGTIVGALTVTASDLTGAGAGWILTTSATPLTSAIGGRTLATSLVTSGTGTSGVACAVSGATCDTTNVSVSPITLNGSAQTLATAAAPDTSGNYGMGAYTFTDNIVTTIPANAFAGTYASVVTLTMSPRTP